jgi:NhaA family Na+:H+ antiporter
MGNKNSYFRYLFILGSPRRIVDMTKEFFQLEAAGGIMLVLASAIALIIANTALYPYYDNFLNHIDFRIGFSNGADLDFGVEKSLLHWINDGLMAIFFLLVGLEIKREVLIGELNDRKKALLPLLVAMGGMIVPAAIYAFINRDEAIGINGWAIPCATDIAFALAVLAILGDRVPVQLKILLTAAAIIDDLLSILIIALFYSGELHTGPLFFALAPLGLLAVLNYYGVGRRAAYILLGVILWFAVLKSGVHATLAGVVTALFIPIKAADPEERRSPLQRLENDLHPWVSFLILPVFGFANAGVPFSGMGFGAFLEPVTLGIILGLVIGKPLGIFGATWLSVKSGLCPMPSNVNWQQIFGMSIVCGIGFTMSLFIGGLAFEGLDLQAEVRLGVLSGSLFSALAGYFILRSTGGKGIAQ